MNWDTEEAFLNRPDSPHPDPQPYTTDVFAPTSQAPFPTPLQATAPPPGPSHMYPYHGGMYFPQMQPSPSSYSSQFESGNVASQTTMFHHMAPHLYHPGYALHSSMPQPSPTRPALNSNGPATNIDARSTTRGKRKRAAPPGPDGRPSASNKRSRRTAAVPTEPSAPSATCGVGPITSVPSHEEDIENQDPNHTAPTTPSVPSSTTPPSSIQYTQRYEHHPASASDVWYFMRALQLQEEPSVKPTNELTFLCKPTAPWVGCKLCIDEWKVWKVGDGMTKGIRKHLQKYHGSTYWAVVKLKNLKNSVESSNLNSLDDTDTPFSVETFLDLLQRWLVVDDQSIHVVECEEFRRLILYLGAGKINDKDLPHRHKMTNMILEAYRKRIEATIIELSRSEGRISFTTDLWSDPVLDSYMALTAHYYIRTEPDRHLKRRNGLVAFRFIEGRHTGVNLAQNFIKIANELKILQKIGAITMDNASNNDAMMKELERVLQAQNIPFDHDGNRIRCFPHIINIACQTILSELKECCSTVIEQPPMSDPPTAKELQDWDNYLSALESDLVGRCRNIVSTCRSSGQRRQALLKKIDDGNQIGYWKGKLDDGKDQIRLVQLLRDCETRWSSTFNMIDRVLELYMAIRDFLLDLEQSDIAGGMLLTSLQKGALHDIHQVLQVAHVAQELLSAERTPTLSMAYPVFETLISKWKALSTTIPELKHFICIGVTKLEEYAGKARKTRLYALSMILNPGQKFSWFRENDQSGQDERDARKWMLEAMLSFRQEQRTTRAPQAPCSHTRSPHYLPSPSELASVNVAHGYNRLQSLDVSVRRSSSLMSVQAPITPTRSGLVAASSSATPTPIPIRETAEEITARKARELEEDKVQMEQELSRYEAAGIITSFENTGMVDIDGFWSVNEHKYPFLFRVAMDVLPAQASSVPCERIFSSSKETCALRRNRLSRGLMEALQVLKYSYRSERLQFVEETAKEADYVIAGPLTEAATDELMAAGKFEELAQLLENSTESL